MIASLRTLLDQAIDYAGLFPPAALPMEQAAAEFAELRHGEHAWLVRRFVCPVAWLGDLLPLLPESVEEPWQVTALGTSLEGYRQDLNAIERFEEQAAGRALVEAYEVKASPADLGAGGLKAVANAGFEEVFVELAWGEEQLDALHRLAAVEGIGAKARTGGLEASAFPSVEQVGAFVHECLSLDLPFKLTAGLHHPLPRHDEGVQARMHGFLNVLLATSLAVAHDWSREEVCRALAEEDAKAIWFTDCGAGWRDWEASLDDLEAGREFFVSWGSCSVQEPLDDLAALRLAEAGR